MLLHAARPRFFIFLIFSAAGELTLPGAARAIPIVSSICDGVSNNLINNCGFETGDFTSWTQGGNTGFTDVTGTLTIGGGGSYAPNSGSYQAELGPSGSDGTLSQTFTTTPGDYYQVDFYMAGEGGTPSDFSAFFNTVTLFTSNPAPQQDYVLYTYTIQASVSASTLEFTFRNDNGFQLLDDVSVVNLGSSPPSIPEPGTYALLGGGLAALAGIARRRQAKARNQ